MGASAAQLLSVVKPCLSALVNSIRHFLYSPRFAASINAWLSSSMGFVPSIAISIRSARSPAFLARSTPMRSASSAPSRMPAVSVMRTGAPHISSVSSSVSRVVPGMEVTIARSVPMSALKRLDLPAFGAPNMATNAPSRNIRAALPPRIK